MRTNLLLAGAFVAGLLPPGAAALAAPAITAADVSMAVPLLPFPGVSSFELSPNSARAIARVDIDDDGDFELWTVPTSGGAAMPLHPPLVNDGTVSTFAITPDSSRVVYRADALIDDKIELWSAPLDGSAAPVNLSELPGGSSDVGRFVISRNGQQVIFLHGDGLLSVAPIDGSADAAALVDPAPAGPIEDDFEFSADGQWVVYRADLNDDGSLHLFSVPASGGTENQLSTAMAVDRDVYSFAIAPVGGRVVFRSDRDVNDDIELFSVPIDDGAVTQLNGPLAVGGDVLVDMRVSPDGLWTVYQADEIDDNEYELFSVSTLGSSSRQVMQALAPGGTVTEWAITADGDRVISRADANGVGTRGLITRPIGGGLPLALSLPNVTASDTVGRMYVSPTENRVIFDFAHDGDRDLYSVPASDGPLTELNVLSPAGSETRSAFTPDGSLLVSLAQRDGVGPDDFVSVAVDGSSEPVSLIPDGFVTSLFGGIDTFEITPDSSRVVFDADPDDDGRSSLYVSSLSSLSSPPPGPVIDYLGAAFTGVGPVRVFDSRPMELPATGPKGIVAPGTSIDVDVTGALSGVPDDAVAVALNVTGTEAMGPGFLTIHPKGSPRPLASSLNLTSSGQTRANAVIVPIGADGSVTVYSMAGAHVVVDVTGYFAPTDTPVSAGRIVPLNPQRVFDTRPGEPAPGPKGYVPAGGTITVQIAGQAGVPADAIAAVLNVAATETGGAGYITVWTSGQSRPLASTLNVNGPGETAPNLVIAPLSASGTIDLFTMSGAHLLADVTGYVTSGSAPADDSGLFVPLAPQRVFDTRPAEAAPGPKGIVAAGSTISVQIGGQVGLPANVGLAVVNLTATQASTGFVTGHPTGQPRPLASILNLNGPNDTRANAALLPLGPGGQLDLYAMSPTHLLADTTGYTLP